MSWPTVSMFIVLLFTIACAYILSLSGAIPLWGGTIINSIVGYLSFSVAHDSIHRSLSTNTRLNDLMGQGAIILFSPYIGIKLFRWVHILHHRFANGPKDPDIILQGAWWTLPFRWILIDVLYLRHVIKNHKTCPKPSLNETIVMALITCVVFLILISMGYWMELLMLWFIPSRLVMLMLGFTFFWLPHAPHDTSQEENFTRATTIRQGYETLLSPLLQYQNFHLIHHLFPMTPFYNNGKVWKLIEPELRQYDLAIQEGLAIQPTIVLASPKN